MDAQTTHPKARGRLFFANPGPTNIPDSILHAVAHHTVDFHHPEFLAMYDACVEGVKRVLGTKQNLFMYTASGHGAWEASLVNLFSPGDTLLIPETGNFSESWGKMAAGHGLTLSLIHI
jgi:alanine-glyoxylate transaminase/serine-glyoxylate transaminase/serine-pyruvate transaminase